MYGKEILLLMGTGFFYATSPDTYKDISAPGDDASSPYTPPRTVESFVGTEEDAP